MTVFEVAARGSMLVIGGLALALGARIMWLEYHESAADWWGALPFIAAEWIVGAMTILAALSL